MTHNRYPQECPVCHEERVNRHDHMKRRHGITMTDWQLQQSKRRLNKSKRLKGEQS